MATAFRSLMAYMAGLLTSLRLFLAHVLMPEITELQDDNERLVRRNYALRRRVKDLELRLAAATPFSRFGLSDHARAILADNRLEPFWDGALLILALTARGEVRTSTEVTHPADRWGVPGIFFSDHPAWKTRFHKPNAERRRQEALAASDASTTA